MKQQEQLGYLHGGYGTLFRRLQKAVVSLKAQTYLGVDIRGISRNQKDPEAGGVLIRARHKDIPVDAVIMTTPNKVVASLLDVDDHLYKEKLGQVTYLGIICTVLVLKRKLSPYYVTNVTEKIGFTGVIEMTNLIDPTEETNGRHLVYLPRYTSPSDPLFAASDPKKPLISKLLAVPRVADCVCTIRPSVRLPGWQRFRALR